MNLETNSTDDDQLDRLLKAVDVPAGLHDRLLSIPGLDEPMESVQTSAKPSVNWQWRSILAIAAGYLLVTLSLVFFWPENSTDVAEKSSGEDVKGSNTEQRQSKENKQRSRASDLKRSELSERQDSFERTKVAVDSIEEKLNELELRRMESRLAALEAEVVNLDSDDEISIVLAVADQSAINFGASRESVVDDLTEVLRRYPDSRGAELANQFVKVTGQ